MSAPFGAFVFRTKDGTLQVVPLGKEEPIAHQCTGQELSDEDNCRLRLNLKEILENPRALFRAFQRSLGEDFSLGYRGGVYFEGGQYSATENEILIQEDNILHTIALDEEGKITSTKQTVLGGFFSSNKETTFKAEEAPEELTEKLRHFYEQLMSCCYSYDVTRNRDIFGRRDRVDFNVTNEGPAIAPFNYLRLFTNFIKNKIEPSIHIFDLHQRQFIGTDAEGLSRTFISALMKGIVHSRYFYDKDNEAFFPCKKGSLSSNDRAFYDQLGTLLAHCFTSGGSFVTGHVFHETFFPTLLAFTPEELSHAVLPPIGVERKLELFRTFIGEEPAYLKLFEILDSNDISSLDDTLLEVYLEGYLPDDPKPNMKTVKKDWSKTWKVEVRKRFVEATEKMGAYNIEALHAIAYRLFKSVNVPFGVSVADRIQGVVDPEVVAKSIDTSSQDGALRIKIEWLKDWIKETDIKNVKLFLEFVGGTRGLPPEQKIKVLRSDSGSSRLSSATCFWNLYIGTGSVDKTGPKGFHSTRERFIECVLESIKVGGYQKD
ncbi:hypothetical protein [Simkania sp.]|uniref:hypothetical protein n=1 Tax=Simkania sp. TaxID=34094 RepID=UPI003B52D456